METEIEALIQLASEGCVDIAAVGNEVLYRNELNEEELLSYISRVKEALPDIPVGYVDAYYEFTTHPQDNRALRCDSFQLLSVLGRLPNRVFPEPYAANVRTGHSGRTRQKSDHHRNGMAK